jgi:hypothetical protein
VQPGKMVKEIKLKDLHSKYKGVRVLPETPANVMQFFIMSQYRQGNNGGLSHVRP